MELIDTHCHLTDLSEEELCGVIARAQARGVKQQICIGAVSGLAGAKRAVEIAEQHPEVFATVGIHPQDAGKVTDTSEIEQYLNHPRVVAIGETGLDFFRDWAPRDQQLKIFRETIGLAKRCQKKLVIHSREAQPEILSTLRAQGGDRVGGVFHCFGGTLEEAKQILDIGFLISITGIVTFKSNHALRDTVRQIPLESLMVETDSPYMAPEPERGKPSESRHVYEIAAKIAEMKGLSLEEVARVTTENARKFFGLPPSH